MTDLDSKPDRIRDTAMRLLAERGAAGVSLRNIADQAGVSLGLLQHLFHTKAELIAAIDDHVLSVLVHALFITPTEHDSASPIEDLGRQVRRLITEHSDVMNYVARTLVDESPAGAAIFDRLVEMGTRRWTQYAEHGLTPDDLDITWAAINPILLCLGAITMRSHVDRHLPQPWNTPAQIQRWEDSVNRLIRSGNFRG